MENVLMKKIGIAGLGYDYADGELEDIDKLIKDLENNNSSKNPLTDKEVDTMINTITKSTADVADKVYAFSALKASTENSIRAYELELDNNSTALSTAEINYQIAQLRLQITAIESEERALESANKTTSTKWIVAGLSIVAIAGIFGMIFYNKK